MLRLPDNERGSALLLLLVVTVVLQILAAVFMVTALTESRIARQHELGIRLHYIAEAGLEQALAMKRVDFGFTGASGPFPCGGGSYSVLVTPDPENPALQHRIDSTGELGGLRLTLGALVEQRELFGKALLTNELRINGVALGGAVHCNSRLRIGSPANRLLPGGALTYSCPLQGIGWAPGAALAVGEESYREKNPLPGSWRRDPLALPQVNLEQITARYRFTGLNGSQEWRQAPYCEGERAYLHLDGALTISPGAGEQFDFSGILLVDGDVRIGGSGTITLEGLILSGGTIAVTNRVNDGGEGRAVVLAAEGDLQLFGTAEECTENPVFGGDLLLFSRRGAVTIGHQQMKGEQFAMHGIVLAKKIAVCNCILTPPPDCGVWSEYFPAYGLVVTEWLQP